MKKIVQTSSSCPVKHLHNYIITINQTTYYLARNRRGETGGRFPLMIRQWQNDDGQL